MILNDQFGYLYLTIWIHVGCPFITMRNALKNIITGGKGWSTYRGYQYLPTPSSQGGSWVAEFGTQTPIHPFGRSQVPRGCLFLLVVKRTKSQLKKSWVAKTTDALRKSEQRELLTNLQAPRIVNSWSYNPYKWPYEWVSGADLVCFWLLFYPWDDSKVVNIRYTSQYTDLLGMVCFKFYGYGFNASSGLDRFI